MAYWIMAKSEGISRNLQVFYYFCECSHKHPLLSNLWGDCSGCEIYWKWEEKLDSGRHKFTGQFAMSAVKPARMGTVLVRITPGSQHAAPIIKCEQKMNLLGYFSEVFINYTNWYSVTLHKEICKKWKNPSALEKHLLSKGIHSRGNQSFQTCHRAGEI